MTTPLIQTDWKDWKLWGYHADWWYRAIEWYYRMTSKQIVSQGMELVAHDGTVLRHRLTYVLRMDSRQATSDLYAVIKFFEDNPRMAELLLGDSSIPWVPSTR